MIRNGEVTSGSYATAGDRSNPRRMFLCAAAGILLSGCVSAQKSVVPAARPVTVAEIVAWGRAGVADEEIVRRIRESGAVYRLRSEDVVALRNQGVSASVVDAMLQGWVDAESRRARNEAVRRARDAAWDPWWGPWWWDDPWWWGHPYPYRWYPYGYPYRPPRVREPAASKPRSEAVPGAANPAPAGSRTARNAIEEARRSSYPVRGRVARR